MTAVSVGWLFVFAGAVAVAIVGRMARKGRLRPNPLAGIRTPYTFSSVEAWYATHRHAGPILEGGAYAVAALSVLCAVLVLAGQLGQTAELVALLAMAAVMAGAAVGAWAIGTRRAKAELSR